MTALLGDVAGLFAQLFLGDEFLYLVDGDCAVKLAAGAGILTAAVADAAADRGERVILLYELERVKVAALGCHLDVALDCDVGRTRGLAGGGTALMAVFLVGVLVVDVPHMLAPVVIVGQRLLGILDGAVLGAQLLAELGGACRTYLYALAAGDALFLVDMCAVCGGGHIGSIKKLRGAQGKAGAQSAVADGEDLILAVDIGYLVDIAVFLGALEDAHRLFIGDVAALAGLGAVSCEGTDCYAALLLQLAAALAHEAHRVSAGAVADAELTLVLLEPMGDMLDIDRLVGRGNGPLDGDDVHAYAVASGRHHRGNMGQGQIRHALEEFSDLRILLDLLQVHVHELRRSGNEDGQNILAAAVGGIVVILQNALERQVIHDLTNIGNVLAHFRCELLGCGGLADIHCQSNVRLLVAHYALKAVVFGVILGYLGKTELLGDAVGHLLAKRRDFFSCHM